MKKILFALVLVLLVVVLRPKSTLLVEEPLDDKIKVEIKGAVNNPGVYELETGKRVEDVIKLSGGLKKDADVSNTNLSKNLVD